MPIQVPVWDSAISLRFVARSPGPGLIGSRASDLRRGCARWITPAARYVLI